MYENVVYSFSPGVCFFSQDNHDRDRAQADRQLQHLNRERAELERSCSQLLFLVPLIGGR